MYTKFTQYGLVLCVLGVLSQNVVAQTPKNNVEKLHVSLITMMKKADSSPVIERYNFLAPILENIFDFDIMIKTAAGAAWYKANAEERKNLRSAFAKVSVATYVTRFPSFDGHAFEFVKSEKGPRNTVLVSTLLDTPKIKPFPLT